MLGRQLLGYVFDVPWHYDKSMCYLLEAGLLPPSENMGG
jgi:hypothetical protein